MGPPLHLNLAGGKNLCDEFFGGFEIPISGQRLANHVFSFGAMILQLQQHLERFGGDIAIFGPGDSQRF